MAAAHTFYVPKLDGLEEEEKKVVARALAKEPTDRYPSCVEMVDEIERALSLSAQRFRLSSPIVLAQNAVAAQWGEETRTGNALTTSNPPPPQRDPGSPLPSVIRPVDSRTDPEMLLPPGMGDWKPHKGKAPGRGPAIAGAVVLGLVLLAAGGWAAWHFLWGGGRGGRGGCGGRVVEVEYKDKDVKKAAQRIKVNYSRVLWLAAGDKREIAFAVEPATEAAHVEVSSDKDGEIEFRAEPREGAVVVTARAPEGAALG